MDEVQTLWIYSCSELQSIGNKVFFIWNQNTIHWITLIPGIVIQQKTLKTQTHISVEQTRIIPSSKYSLCFTTHYCINFYVFFVGQKGIIPRIWHGKIWSTEIWI